MYLTGPLHVARTRAKTEVEKKKQPNTEHTQQTRGTMDKRLQGGGLRLISKENL